MTRNDIQLFPDPFVFMTKFLRDYVFVKSLTKQIFFCQAIEVNPIDRMGGTPAEVLLSLIFLKLLEIVIFFLCLSEGFKTARDEYSRYVASSKRRTCCR